MQLEKELVKGIHSLQCGGRTGKGYPDSLHTVGKELVKGSQIHYTCWERTGKGYQINLYICNTATTIIHPLDLLL